MEKVSGDLYSLQFSEYTCEPFNVCVYSLGWIRFLTLFYKVCKINGIEQINFKVTVGLRTLQKTSKFFYSKMLCPCQNLFYGQINCALGLKKTSLSLSLALSPPWNASTLFNSRFLSSSVNRIHFFITPHPLAHFHTISAEPQSRPCTLAVSRMCLRCLLFIPSSASPIDSSQPAWPVADHA